MAKQNRNACYPVDTPIVKSRGVVYQESACFAQNCSATQERGFGQAQVDGTSAVGRRNGARNPWPERVDESSPFANVRG